MITDDRRDGEGNPTHQRHATDDMDEDEFSLGPLIRTLWNYRRVIVASVSALLIGFMIWAMGTYVFQPAERQAGLEFRLIFEGADVGEYPNGLPFSSAEIIGAQVLTEVFEADALERYTTYERFKNGIFILEASREAELLGFEYQSKLADTRLTSVERARLEEEFDQKREALRVPQYVLSFMSQTGVTSIPDALMGKVLSDILAVWAEQATTRKGVLVYQVGMYTKNLLLNDFLEADDYIIRMDVLRGKVKRFISNLIALEALPGARVIRVGETRISLTEIRANLEDLVSYRLEPLTGYIWANSISRDLERLKPYLENRQFQITLELGEAEGRGKVLEEALRGYIAGAGPSALGFGVGDGGGPITGGPMTAPIPLIGDSFLDRIIEWGAEDVEYRQNLTNEIIKQRHQTVALERETAYYERMNESMLRALGFSEEASETEALRAVENRFAEIYDAVLQGLEQSNAIYSELSAKNLNPRTNLFTTTSPFSWTTQRTFTLSTLGLYGLLTLTVGLIVVPLACLTHHYFRQEILSARLARQKDVPQQAEPAARVETADGP